MKGALKGLIRLQENENGQLMFSGEISGLKPPGNHGFHVHQVFHDGGDDDDDDGDGDDLYIIGAVCLSVCLSAKVIIFVFKGFGRFSCL